MRQPLRRLSYRRSPIAQSAKMFAPYPAKMFAFSTQAGYDRDMVEKLEALCKFNALFYVEKWLRSSVGVDAPFNDLQLWHSLNDYRVYDSAAADAAITALERHL